MRNPMIHLLTIYTLFFTMGTAVAGSLTPPEEPKNDSFYICYEQRLPNDIAYDVFAKFTGFKYIGCIISRLPCHLYCGDKFHAQPANLKQFQWVNTYPKALNSFYRCAYS